MGMVLRAISSMLMNVLFGINSFDWKVGEMDNSSSKSLPHFSFPFATPDFFLWSSKIEPIMRAFGEFFFLLVLSRAGVVLMSCATNI